MNLLHLDSSILGANSASRALSAAAVARLTAANPGLKVTYRDLAAEPITHVSGEIVAAMGGGGGEHDAPLSHDLAVGAAVLEEFLAADIVVIGVALYNFTISTQLKAWVDRIIIAGKTFSYGEKGAVGLAGDKRVILTIARGGFYGPGSPVASLEHAESLLRGVFTFLGVTNLEVIVAEGLRISDDHRQAAMDVAREKIAELV